MAQVYPGIFMKTECSEYPVPGTPEIDFLHTLWDVCNDAAEPGAWTHHSGRMLDYISTFPKGAVKLLSFTVGAHTVASDHCPVSAELEF